MEDIKFEFRSWQKKHPNFMTPNVKKIYSVDNKIIEISEGTGMKGERIFGVTKLERIGEFQFKSLGGELFHDQGKAEQYAKKLTSVV
jgi:hypothetical protein